MSEFDFTQALINHDSNYMDLQLQDILGQAPLFPHLRLFEASFQQPAVATSQSYLSTQQSGEQNDQSDQSSSYEPSPFSPLLKSGQNSKEIFKSLIKEDTRYVDNQRLSKKQKRLVKRKGEKQQGYPTKNFLPCFKLSHLRFLQNQLGFEYVNQFEIVKAIKLKSGISLKDYEALYKVPFFAMKVLYRDLMLSRSQIKARKVHLKKIPVFEKAFREKLFEKIN